MNIVVLMAGGNAPGSQEAYPFYLTEVRGRIILERQLDFCLSLAPTQVIFCVSTEDIKKYRVDHVVQQCSDAARCIPVHGHTAGAICTALLGGEWIDNGDELLLLAVDDFIEEDALVIVEQFRSANWDAGIVCFRSVHPRYSFATIAADGLVQEVSEKLPVSRNALASFYYFRRGHDFVDCAKAVIRKDSRINGAFYISQVINEMILRQSIVGAFPISNDAFHPMKSELQLAQYVSDLQDRKDSK